MFFEGVLQHFVFLLNSSFNSDSVTWLLWLITWLKGSSWDPRSQLYKIMIFWGWKREGLGYWLKVFVSFLFFPLFFFKQQLRMTTPLQHHHHQSRLPGARGGGGPGLFPDPGAPIPQQPLQMLMPHLSHRSPGPRTQHDTHGLRLLSSPPRHSNAHPNQHQQHQQHHPKNIHINPHFRGPSSSPVQGTTLETKPATWNSYIWVDGSCFEYLP